MLADEREVNYSYTGDVSSLRKATEEALGLLDRYQDQIDRLVKTGDFSGNQKAVKSFASNISSTAREVTKLQEKLNSLRSIKIPSSSQDVAQLASSVANVEKVFKNLATSSRMSTAEVRQQINILKEARKGFVDSGAGIEAYVQKEAKFQDSVSRINTGAQRVRGLLDSMSNSAEKMSGRLTSAFDPFISRIRSLTSPLTKAGATVESFKVKAETALNRITFTAATLAGAFKTLRGSTDDEASSLTRVSAQLRNVASAAKTAQTRLSKLSDMFKTASQSGKRFAETLKDVGDQASKTSNRSSALSTSLKRLFAVSAGFSLGRVFGKALEESISYVENLNLFTVAMGESLEEGLKFVDMMQEVYGMDPSNLYRYAGYFYQLSDAIGVTDEASASMSLSLTKAANDLASLFNMDIETVVENLASGLQGMTRAVRKYGMDIRTTTLQQTALKYGLTENVETMSEANRVALRFLTMMEQANNAINQTNNGTAGAAETMGDFARNIETPANQLRIFKEQITQLGRAIGNFFLPILAKILPYINGIIMAIRTVLEALSALFGFNTQFGGEFAGAAESGAEAVSGIGDAADTASKKLKQFAAPFDELNVLSQNAAGSVGGVGGGGFSSEALDPRLAEAIKNMELKLENIRMKAVEVRDALLDFFGFDYVSVFNPDTGEYEQKLQWFADKFRANLIAMFPQWTNTINALFDNWSDIIDGLKNVFKALGNVIAEVGRKLKSFFAAAGIDNAVAAVINNLAGALNGLADWINDHSSALANLIIILGALWSAFQVFTTVAGILAPVVSALATIAGFAATLNPVVLVIVGIGAALAGLSLVSDEVAGTMKALFGNIGSMIKSSAEVVVTTFNNNIKPAFSAFVELLGTLMDAFNNLWSTVIGPIVESIGSAIASLWNSTLMPIFQEIIGIIGGLIEIQLILWNDVMLPLLSWLIDVLGPSVTNLVISIFNIIKPILEAIGGLILGLLQALGGLIEFLAGVFTSDWERAWNGIKNIFVGIANALVSVFELAFNLIIGVVNAAISLIYNAVVALINTVLGAFSSIANLVGFDLDIQIDAPPPQIPPVKVNRVPKAMATGGVVTRPTEALIGEGKYDEAVIPLGQSPQMQEMLQQFAEVARQANENTEQTPIEVHVYLGGKEVDAEIYKSAQRGKKVVGAQPIKTGG